jgi:cytochrome c553
MTSRWGIGLATGTIAAVLGLLGCGERQTTTHSPSAQATNPQPVIAPGTPITFATVCALCHGTRGEGNLALRTPSIAGLPEWYVRLQLNKFRNNLRGADPLDAEGQRMHAVARGLSADDVLSLASTIAAM